jgi:hypothetical protein
MRELPSREMAAAIPPPSAEKLFGGVNTVNVGAERAAAFRIRAAARDKIALIILL